VGAVSAWAWQPLGARLNGPHREWAALRTGRILKAFS